MKGNVLKIAARARALARNESGNVALMVTLALPALLLSIGGGADYARILAAKSKLQAATDSAALAAYMHYTSNPRASNGQIKQQFQRQLRASLQSRFEGDISVRDIQLQLLRREGKLIAKVKADYPTTFIRLAGIPSMTLNTEAQVEASVNATEVVLVLDITGSMQGSKLTELKRASKRFLETIYRRLGDNSQDAFKVGIVPFAQYVNVGKQYRNASWIDVPPDRTLTRLRTGRDCGYSECVRREWQTWYDCWWTGNADAGTRTRKCVQRSGMRCVESRYISTKCTTHTWTQTRRIYWEGCVGSRNYSLNLKDEGYGSRIPGIMNHPRRPSRPASSFDGWYLGERNQCPRAAITPLTSLKTSKDQLIRKINSLSANGFTYIPAGLIWGWRVLSHQAPFTEGASDAEVRQKNTSKIIVLMTDGANTRAPDRRRDRLYAEHRQDDRNYADRMTRELCNNIKAINPATGKRYAEIITVTFAVRDRGIKALMQNCATMGSFDARSGQLINVFDQIAQRLVELHLSR